MWRAIRAIFKWASVVVGLIVLTVAAFAIGWKSWVPPKMQLQASTRPTLEASTRANDLVRNTNIKEKPAQPVDQLIEDAMGAARFGGGMGLGSAKAMQLIESLKGSELPRAFAAVVEGELTASREKIAQLILDNWSRIDPNAAMEACAATFTSREK